MKAIIQKNVNVKAPGGNLYLWKKVKTYFEISNNGIYAIKIEASCKNARQNNGTDDDDLRVSLDNFDFGKYEIHDEKVSWKGFGTSSSWNGASLKGGSKTIYFFVELQKGKHTLQFFADETPTLQTIEIAEVENYHFELKNLKPPENIQADKNGIPWISFVFLGALTKTVTMGVKTRSAIEKKSGDGDNVKVVVNGKIQQNKKAPTSDKYKSFYFSGDLQEFDVLTITHEDFVYSLAFENSLELWYDQEPEITSLKIEFFDEKAFLEYLDSLDLKHLRIQILAWAYLVIAYFLIKKKKYSAKFLKNAIREQPENLVLKATDPIVKELKNDPTYTKILKKLKEKIGKGLLDGEIWPADFKDDPEMDGEINFNSDDLATSLHGIQKIEYSAHQDQNGVYVIEMTLFDVYDFSYHHLPFLLKNFSVNNLLDRGEELGVIQNYEIKIHINENIYVQ